MTKIDPEAEVFRFQVFLSGHYAGDPLVPKFDDGEPWKKVFGPVFIYCNSCPGDADWHWLWEDAKQQVNLCNTGFCSRFFFLKWTLNRRGYSPDNYLHAIRSLESDAYR